jgi:ParB family chromosome partitioning protein
MTQVTKRKTGLGRGLSALLENADQDSQLSNESNAIGSVALISLANIDANPFQPRTEFDATALDELGNLSTFMGSSNPLRFVKWVMISTNLFPEKEEPVHLF